ncbi:MAG: dihydroxyacetone kinase subunit L [Cyclobacteriaceae bacterium]|nr:dihydroxyacetone kinase subunit L [Cyclobacteriaceae bacterium HetDA_MAG_MS6]
MKTFDVAAVEKTVKIIAETAIANEKYFSDLDAAAGDADFGTSLATGFKVVLDKWEEYDRSSIGDFLLKVSMVITGHVGGSSGPLWGTAFMKSGLLSKGKSSIGYEELAKMVQTAVDGIMARGGAKPGDKTLIDGLLPIAEKLEKSQNETNHSKLLKELVEITAHTAETTTSWVAKFGRQSFTGERSAGTPDPGIVAISTIVKAIAQS